MFTSGKPGPRRATSARRDRGGTGPGTELPVETSTSSRRRPSRARPRLALVRRHSLSAISTGGSTVATATHGRARVSGPPRVRPPPASGQRHERSRRHRAPPAELAHQAHVEQGLDQSRSSASHGETSTASILTGRHRSRADHDASGRDRSTVRSRRKTSAVNNCGATCSADFNFGQAITLTMRRHFACCDRAAARRELRRLAARAAYARASKNALTKRRISPGIARRASVESRPGSRNRALT